MPENQQRTSDFAELRERIAVALNRAGAYCGDCSYEEGFDCDDCHECCHRYADAVIALFKPVLSIPPIDCTNSCMSDECDCSGEMRVRGWGLIPALSGASHKVEQPRAATVDMDPQDAAASLGELSLPAEDGAGLPVAGASEGSTEGAVEPGDKS